MATHGLQIYVVSRTGCWLLSCYILVGSITWKYHRRCLLLVLLPLLKLLAGPLFRLVVVVAA